MARSIVQTEMINRTAYRELQEAGMDAPQAEAVAAHLPDWSQFAIRQDLASIRQDLAQLENRLTWRMVQIVGLPVVLLVLAFLVDYFFVRSPGT